MRSLLDAIKSGEMLEGKEIVNLAKIMDEFRQTEIYQIIKTLNENAIKDLLTVGKTSDETAEHRLGKMEGIQEAFENRIRSIIAEGDAELQRQKAERELKKEEKLESVLDEEEINQTSGVDQGV